MSSVPWSKECKPRVIVIISVIFISLRVNKEQQDLTGMGRWTSIIINGHNKSSETIISAYRVCVLSISHAWSHISFYQQGNMMEEKVDKKIQIQKQMKDNFDESINKLQVNNHEIILTVDANETFKWKNWYTWLI